jgi:fumarylacetoacetase
MSDGFGLDHLPYGVFSVAGDAPRVGVRYGDAVVDLYALTGRDEFAQPALNAFMTLGPGAWATTRTELVDRVPAADAVPLDGVDLHLPFTVGDYVDFYASLDHASNVGRIFRPGHEPPLLPNWRHLPVGYHGRAGTVVVSGTPVVRPCGQRAPSTGSTGSTTGDPPTPEYGPSRRLDIEAELGFVVGSGSERASRIGVGDLADHVFGIVGLNDWSARDIQAWEYVPLGPFLGKSFATSIGAWVTPLAALDAAWCDLPGQDPTPLPYLVSTGSTGGPEARGLDIEVEVVLNGEIVSRPPYRTMYWSPAQMLAHLTVNGASTRPGDLFASGTISGPDPETRGSFLELSWGGTEPFAGGHTFLEDGDEVTLRYSAPGTGGGRITLGEVTGRIEPARV